MNVPVRPTPAELDVTWSIDTVHYARQALTSGPRLHNQAPSFSPRLPLLIPSMLARLFPWARHGPARRRIGSGINSLAYPLATQPQSMYSQFYQ